MRTALDRLFPQNDSVLLDGAMGTGLRRLGWPPQMATVMANVEAPEWVQQIHQEHLAAGAQILLSNTFGVLLGADDQRLDVARTAAQLALKAAGGRAHVAGSLAAHDLHFHGTILDDIVHVLVDEGVDLLVFETCNSQQDARLAMDVAHRVAPRLPVVICASTTDGTRDDHKRVHEIARLVAANNDPKDPQVELGLNCCRGPYETLRVALALDSIPRWIKPSTGLPGDQVNDHVMAAFARAARIHGARYLGGCCGTEADTLDAMAGALNYLDH